MGQRNKPIKKPKFSQEDTDLLGGWDNETARENVSLNGYVQQGSYCRATGSQVVLSEQLIAMLLATSLLAKKVNSSKGGYLAKHTIWIKKFTGQQPYRDPGLMKRWQDLPRRRKELSSTEETYEKTDKG